jgi:hypothetical protein
LIRPADLTAPRQPAMRELAWALGALVVVALVIGDAYAGHRYMAHAQLAASRVPAPATPPTEVLRVLRPEDGASFVAAAGSGRLVLLASPHEATCELTGTCAPASLVDGLYVMDAATGDTLAHVALSGSAQQPVALVVDQQAGLVGVVSATRVDVFAAATGAQVASFALPSDAVAGSFTGATTTSDGTLLLTVRQGGMAKLLALDERSGTTRYAVTLGDGTSVDGPAYDPSMGLVLALASQPGGERLEALYAASGALRDVWSVPDGTRLGPIHDASGLLLLFGPDGTTSSLVVPGGPAVPPAGSATPGGAIPQAPAGAVPALRGAQAVGWNSTLGHVYVADGQGIQILDAATGRVLASLPVSVVWPPDQPLPVDEAAGLVYVPSDHGTVLVVRDGRGSAAQALTPDTAAVLARDAVVRLVPQAPQDPPFLSVATFLPGAGVRNDVPFRVYDSTIGWQDAGPGTVRIDVAPVAGSAGAFDATVTITWWQHRFLHIHIWVGQVGASGAVRTLSDQGDALP